MKGQAVFEYLFLLLMSVYIGAQLVQSMSSFMGETMGEMGIVLQTHLTVGVCDRFCWYSGYNNGSEN